MRTSRKAWRKSDEVFRTSLLARPSAEIPFSSRLVVSGRPVDPAFFVSKESDGLREQAVDGLAAIDDFHRTANGAHVFLGRIHVERLAD